MQWGINCGELSELLLLFYFFIILWSFWQLNKFISLGSQKPIYTEDYQNKDNSIKNNTNNIKGGFF